MSVHLRTLSLFCSTYCSLLFETADNQYIVQQLGPSYFTSSAALAAHHAVLGDQHRLSGCLCPMQRGSSSSGYEPRFTASTAKLAASHEERLMFEYAARTPSCCTRCDLSRSTELPGSIVIFNWSCCERPQHRTSTSSTDCLKKIWSTSRATPLPTAT